MQLEMTQVKNVLVILAAGKGLRYKAKVPKQFSLLNGRELISYSIEEMTQSEKTDRLLVVLNNDAAEVERVKAEYGVEVIPGGEDRAHSFQRALDHIANYYGSCEKVIFHEAARPLVQHGLIDYYFDLLDQYDYVETCQKIKDSLGSLAVKAPNRDDYYLIQAPEAYRFDMLHRYFDAESRIYFAAHQLPDSAKGCRYYGIGNNFKLTEPSDKQILECLLASRGASRRS